MGESPRQQTPRLGSGLDSVHLSLVAVSPATKGSSRRLNVKLSVVVHEAEEGGYWAEVPAIPGCATQGESFEELLTNLYEAVEGCLSVAVNSIQLPDRGKVIEIAV